MEATQKGKTVRAAFSREEIWACLECTGDSEQYSVVHMSVNGSGKLRAVASDGKRRRVKVDAPAKNVASFDVVLDAAHLEKGRAAVKNGESLVLEITEGGKVKDLLIVDGESGDSICPLGWHRQIEDTTITMADIISEIVIPNDKEYRASWFAWNPGDAARVMERVRVATDDCPVTVYPPSSPNDPICFEARSDKGHWTGTILPEKVLGPGDQADEPPDPDEGAPGRDDRQAKLDLRERANKPREDAGAGETDDNGDESAIVSDDYADKVKAQQARAAGDMPDPAPSPQPPKKNAKAKVKNRSKARS